MMTHYLKVGQKQDGQPSHTTVHADESSQGKLSSLIVLNTRPVHLKGFEAGLPRTAAYESHISLITGRTHQVKHTPPEE